MTPPLAQEALVVRSRTSHALAPRLDANFGTRDTSKFVVLVWCWISEKRLRLQWGSLKSATFADFISRGGTTGLSDTMKIRAPKDFWSGVMFCGFAAVAIFAARGYSLGSAGRMGPGYFPLLLAGLLASLGGASIARSS